MHPGCQNDVWKISGMARVLSQISRDCWGGYGKKEIKRPYLRTGRQKGVCVIFQELLGYYVWALDSGISTLKSNTRKNRGIFIINQKRNFGNKKTEIDLKKLHKKVSKKSKEQFKT